MEDELQDFLDEVDDVYQEIHKLATEPAAELPAERKSRIELKRKKEAEARQRELELQYKGRPGHGEKFTTYEHYCPRCQLEFTVAMPTCSQCGKASMSPDERREDLTAKVYRLKEDRAKAAENRMRWENWKKTEAMLYRKTATNYRKWDYFEAEDEKEEELPFVPPEDPAFKEMERDMEERKVRRKADKKRAEELKEKGNTLFKQGNLMLALEAYEEAQKTKRDWMILYTNSAIVRIKLKDYTKAIEDCTRVLEYCEVFEDGYTRSPDLCFKALTRRAMAKRGLSQPSSAVDDLTQALRIRKDGEAEGLLRRCQEEARLLPAQEVEESIEEVTDAAALTEALQSESELMRFVSRGGYQSLAHQVYLRQNRAALQVLLSLCSDPANYLRLYPLTKRVKGDINGVVRLIRAAEKATHTDIGMGTDIMGIVAVATENGEVREELMEQCVNARKWKITLMLYSLFLSIPKTEAAVPCTTKLLAAISNLCLTVKATAVAQSPNPGDMKDIISAKWTEAKEQLLPLLSFQALLSTLLSLFCNLAVKPELRAQVAAEEPLLSAVVRELGTSKQADVLETGLGLLINCMTNTSAGVDCEGVIRVAERCLSFVKSTDTIQQRAIFLVARMTTYREDCIPSIASNSSIQQSVQKSIHDPSIFQHSVKVLIQCCRVPGFAQALPHKEISAKVAKVLSEYAAGSGTIEMAGNAALLVCRVVDASVECASQYSELIPTLISTVGQKADVVRKNCALALGRLAKDPSNLQQIRDLHGMDVLRSVAGFVLD